MRPGIQPGSYVLIRRATSHEVIPGDVILARTVNGVRLHRLVEIQGRGSNASWITRGDSHRHCDPPLNSGQILGVLAHVERPRPLHWLRRRLARIA